MISSKFCIDFFFRYNSKLLITPIPEINFDEFNLLLMKLNLPNSFTPPLIPNKYQELLYICLLTFQSLFDDLLNGPTTLSQSLEGLIFKFKAFVNIEIKAITVYNEAKLFLFQEIDYLTLTYRRILNFLQDLDQYIVNVLKRQALIDSFHKAFSDFFQEVVRFQPILEKIQENRATFEIFDRVKGFLSEKMLDINEIWASDSNRKMINDQNSENLSIELNETPNKFNNGALFQASMLQKDQHFSERSDVRRSVGEESQIQIEIELKNLNLPEETLLKSRNPFDETFLPLKDANFCDSYDSLTQKEKAAKFVKTQTKTLDPKTIPENSLLFRPKPSMTLVQGEYLDPKNSFRKFYFENSKYQVKTKEKNTSLKKMPISIQVNGVVFIDPLYLLDQDNNRKEDFSLFNDFIDEDIDENTDLMDQSFYYQGAKSSLESKAMLDDESITKQEALSPKKQRKKKKKVSSKIKQKPSKLKSSLKGGKSNQNLQTPIITQDISPQQKNSEPTFFPGVNNLSSSSQIFINIMQTNHDNYNNDYSSSEENLETDGFAASPLIKRHNFLKKTFVEGSFRMQKSTIIMNNTSDIMGLGFEDSNIDVMLAEPEILKAISLSCGVSNNHSSVFFSKWVAGKQKRKVINNGRVHAQKRWVIVRKMFKGFLFAKKSIGIAKNFEEFIRKRLFRNEELWFGKVMVADGLILMGKGTQQGQGEGDIDCHGEFIYANNRKIRGYGVRGYLNPEREDDLY